MLQNSLTIIALSDRVGRARDYITAHKYLDYNMCADGIHYVSYKITLSIQVLCVFLNGKLMIKSNTFSK